MEEYLRRGTLAKTSFVRVLAQIWREELTGALSVRGADGTKLFTFDGGFLVVGRASLPEKDFLKSLLTSGTADLISLAQAEEYAERRGVSVLRALLEIPLIDPGRLWPLLEQFVKEEAWSCFDREEGEFEFAVPLAPAGPALLRLYVPDLILEGGRRMRNEAVIGRELPPDGETVQGLSPDILDLLDLLPHERYFLGLLDSPLTLTELYDASVLGRGESRRALAVFLCLGLAGTRSPRPKTGRLPAEMSLADMDKLFGVFNAKCSYIFKYISKEIGPVALSVIGNSLEDVRGRLDPVFQDLELKADGRIEVTSFLKTSMSIDGDESRRGLLRSMDEILVAEVLAVKRTLGSGHESALVKSLEKIGEIP
ncbi:MAG: DUF4388 domain-containing protein [Acidobacteriota bacterium]